MNGFFVCVPPQTLLSPTTTSIPTHILSQLSLVFSIHQQLNVSKCDDKSWDYTSNAVTGTSPPQAPQATHAPPPAPPSAPMAPSPGAGPPIPSTAPPPHAVYDHMTTQVGGMINTAMPPHGAPRPMPPPGYVGGGGSLGGVVHALHKQHPNKQAPARPSSNTCVPSLACPPPPCPPLPSQPLRCDVRCVARQRTTISTSGDPSHTATCIWSPPTHSRESLPRRVSDISPTIRPTLMRASSAAAAAEIFAPTETLLFRPVVL